MTKYFASTFMQFTFNDSTTKCLREQHYNGVSDFPTFFPDGLGVDLTRGSMILLSWLSSKSLPRIYNDSTITFSYGQDGRFNSRRARIYHIEDDIIPKVMEKSVKCLERFYETSPTDCRHRSTEIQTVALKGGCLQRNNKKLSLWLRENSAWITWNVVEPLLKYVNEMSMEHPAISFLLWSTNDPRPDAKSLKLCRYMDSDVCRSCQTEGGTLHHVPFAWSKSL